MEPDIERSFFDILGKLTGAFAQTGYIVAGTVFLLLGGVLVADWLRWKIKGEELEATIIGLRQRGGNYFPVYRYSLDGVTQEATSNSGSSSTRGQETGRQLNILVMRHDPGRAQPAKGLVWPLVGVVLAAPGFYMVWLAFTKYEVNGFTWATLAVLAFMSLNKFRGAIIPKHQRLDAETWRLQRRQELNALPVQTTEDIRQSPETKQQEARAAKQAMVAGPLLMLAGAAAIAGAIYFGSETFDLLGAERAAGQVTQLAGEYSGGKNNIYGYHAIVRFKDEEGREITFRDKFGSNPAIYEEGEAVDVLYHAESAQDSAVIDRGIFNWLVPSALGLFGFLFLLGGIARMPRQHDEAY